MTCGYSKVEAQDAETNVAWKNDTNMTKNDLFSQPAEFWYNLGIFSAYDDRNWKRIFALVSASRASSFEYPHAIL